MDVVKFGEIGELEKFREYMGMERSCFWSPGSWIESLIGVLIFPNDFDFHCFCHSMAAEGGGQRSEN